MDKQLATQANEMRELRATLAAHAAHTTAHAASVRMHLHQIETHLRLPAAVVSPSAASEPAGAPVDPYIDPPSTVQANVQGGVRPSFPRSSSRLKRLADFVPAR